MKVEQRRWTAGHGWQPRSCELSRGVQLVLAFGGTDLLAKPGCLQELKACYPAAHLVGCSTAGEIFGTQVADNSLTATAVEFSDTAIQGVQATLSDAKESFSCGAALARRLPRENFTHAFVLSEGLKINGSELVRGLTAHA